MFNLEDDRHPFVFSDGQIVSGYKGLRWKHRVGRRRTEGQRVDLKCSDAFFVNFVLFVINDITALIHA